MSRVLRWTVPVDGQSHRIAAGVRHVSSRNAHSVEVWTTPLNRPDIAVQVVATGQDYPRDWQWIGTAEVPGVLIVWHLMQTDELARDLPLVNP